MRDISGATESQTRTKRYACFAAAAVALFFVLSLSGGNEEAGSDVIGGQAKHHIGKIKIDQGNAADDGIDEDAEFAAAQSKFNRTVNEQINMNENGLSEAMDKELEKIDADLGDLLSASGVEFSEEEITRMKEGIRNQTDSDVHTYIRDQADEVMNSETIEFQNDLDQDAGDTKADGKLEAETQTKEIVGALKDKIDEIADNAKKQMKSFAAGAEKKILEQTFEEKTSQSYVATISDENTVTSVQIKAEEPKTTKKGAKKAAIAPPSSAPKPKNTKKGKKKDSEPAEEDTNKGTKKTSAPEEDQGGPDEAQEDEDQEDEEVVDLGDDDDGGD